MLSGTMALLMTSGKKAFSIIGKNMYKPSCKIIAKTTSVNLLNKSLKNFFICIPFKVGIFYNTRQEFRDKFSSKVCLFPDSEQ